MNTARSWGDIRNATIVSASIGVACFLIFGLLRSSIKVYRTRLLHHRVASKPPPLPDNPWTFLFDWVLHVLSIDEQALYDTAGLDSLYFDRSNRLCMIIATFAAIANLGIILPVNYLMGTAMSDVEAVHVGGMSMFDRMSMTNIPASSPLLWIHTITVIITVLFVCSCLYVNFIDYRADRQAWLGHSVQEDDKYFENIPETTSMARSMTISSNADDVSCHGQYTTKGGNGMPSLLRRRFSQHVHDAELFSASEAERVQPNHDRVNTSCFKADNSLEISEVHSPLSVFHRQHVSVPVEGPGDSPLSTWKVKAQQYSVLVTNVNPISRAIRNPEGYLIPMRAAQRELTRTFETLFPADFVTTVPVHHHAKIDALLRQLDNAQVSLLRLEECIATLERGKQNSSASKRLKRMESKRDSLSSQIRRLVAEIKQARLDSESSPRSGLAFFVIFKSQASAAIAAQTLLQEPGGELPW